MATLEQRKNEIFDMIRKYNADCDSLGLGGEKINCDELDKVTENYISPEEKIHRRLIGLSDEFNTYVQNMHNYGVDDTTTCYPAFRTWLTRRGFHAIPNTPAYADSYGIVAEVACGTIYFYHSDYEYKSKINY